MLLVPAWLILASPAARGGAPVHGAKAAGMGTTFTAVADDPSAILHNPAGLARLPDSTMLYGGATLLLPSSSYESPAGDKVETRFQAFLPPHLFLVHRLPAGFTAGLGIYAPFGVGGRKWPADGPTRYEALEGFISTLALNPTLAMRISTGWSLGVGADYLYALNFSRRAVDQSALGGADGRLEVEADGAAWGYNLGLFYQSGTIWSLGIAYRSPIDVDQKGDFELEGIAPPLQGLLGGARFNSPIRLSVDFPQVLSLGMAWRIGRRWTLAADAEWTGWSSFKRTTLDLLREVPAAGVTDTTREQNLHDAWAYKAGADYQVNARFSLRAGYAYLNSPVPEATLSAMRPDADQHNFSLGAGWRQGPWVVDGYYNLGHFEKRRVSNEMLSGEYKTTIHYLGVSIGYRQ